MAFAKANGADANSVGPGTNYLEVCETSVRSGGGDAHLARQALNGIKDVIAGTLSHFSLQYPCSSQTEERWFTLRASPLRLEFEPSARCLLSHIDISEAKAMEIEAVKASAIKSHFLSTMSHEFRTPLNAILGFSEVIGTLKFETDGSDRLAEYVDAIHKSGKHMLVLVNDLLDMAAIEAGTRTLHKAHVDIRPILQSCTMNAKVLAAARGIEVALDVADDLLPVFADKHALTQIFNNLLVNAIKFSEDKSTVAVSATPGNESTLVSVVDHGIGMSGREIELVTQPFWRAQSDAHVKSEGTGLGLSIVKALVEQHGGKLDIRSKVGEGTTAAVSLPTDPTA